MLKGKRCLVTGAGRGIGRSIAIALARESASLALAARSRDQLTSVARECVAAGAPVADVHPIDLANGAAIDALAQDLAGRQGGVSVLVNNAAVLADGMSALEGDLREWEKTLMVNLMAPMRLTRRLAPGMVERKEGAILNISSNFGVDPSRHMAVYAATKFGLRGWSLSCHETLRRSNVKVVSINPGVVDTTMTADQPGAIPEEMITPDDVAEACLLALKTSLKCVPTDITLRNSQNCAYHICDPTEMVTEMMATGR